MKCKPQKTFRAESPAADRSLDNAVEPDLHLIQPGGVSGSEVHIKARLPSASRGSAY